MAPTETEIRHTDTEMPVRARMQQLLQDMLQVGAVDMDAKQTRERTANRLPDGLCELVIEISELKPAELGVSVDAEFSRLNSANSALEYLGTLEVVGKRGTGSWNIAFVPETDMPPSDYSDEEKFSDYRTSFAASQIRLVQAALVRSDICEVREIGPTIFIQGKNS